MEKKNEVHIDRRVVRTKQAIRDALARLSEKEDYRKITVTALAREANIDRKTFYLHYSSIDDVITEAVHEEAQRVIHALKDITIINEDSMNVADLYDALGTKLVPSFSPSKESAQHLPMELVIESAQRELIQLLAEDENSQIKHLGPLLEFAVAFIVSGSFAAYRRWILSESEVPLENLSEMITKLAFNGISAIIKDKGDGVSANEPA